MLGHDVSWAAFHVTEVMAQERFAFKRIGALFASQVFSPTTDVIVLFTHLLKKVRRGLTWIRVSFAPPHRAERLRRSS